MNAETFDLARLAGEKALPDSPYSELLRVTSLSAGLYTLAPLADDPQQPHTEDELYYVIRGRGKLQLGDGEIAVGPGSLTYVPAGLPHRFVAIEDRLVVLVIFGPAEGTAA